MDATRQASRYAKALNDILDRCGYNRDAVVWNREKIRNWWPHCNAQAAVVCEIGGLLLRPDHILFDGHRFDIKVEPVEGVSIEPISGYAMGFYQWSGK